MNVSGLASATDNARQLAANALSSGKRITPAAVDPSGLAISEALLSQATSDTQGAANAQDAINAANVAGGALLSISSDAQQLHTLAIAGNNDFLSSSERTAIQAQANQTTQEINSVAQSANFNGEPLLSGPNASANVQTGSAEGATSTLSLAPAGSGALGISLIDLSSSAAAATSETSADTALTTITSHLATLGAQQVQLGLDQQNSQTASANLTASAADIADTNVNTTATSLANAQARETLQLELQGRLAASSIARGLLGSISAG